MLQKWLMLTLSSTLFFIMPNTVKPFHNQAMQIAENKVNANEMIQLDRFGLLTNPIQEQFEKDKLELGKNKVEEEYNQQKQLEEQNKNELQWQTFIVSYYTGLDEENYEGCGGRNCLNQPLERGMIANNSLPLGTQIFLDNDYGVRTVADKGSNRFNSENRIDLFVARYDGESKEQWKKRANSYGIQHIRGYIIK